MGDVCLPGRPPGAGAARRLHWKASAGRQEAGWASDGALEISQKLTRELAGHGQALLGAGEGPDGHGVIHICAQVRDGGLRGSGRQRQLSSWFLYRNPVRGKKLGNYCMTSSVQVWTSTPGCSTAAA